MVLLLSSAALLLFIVYIPLYLWINKKDPYLPLLLSLCPAFNGPSTNLGDDVFASQYDHS